MRISGRLPSLSLSLALLAAVSLPAGADHLCTANNVTDVCDEPGAPPGVDAMCSNGFTIDFVSRVLNPGPPETTTFNYVIDGPTGNGCRRNPDISHFSLAWELCVGDGQTDLQFFGSVPFGELKTGLEGDPSTGYCVNDPDADFVKFDVGVPCSGAPVPFSVTFFGNVPLGDAEMMFKAANRTYIADVPGPACPEEVVCDEELGPFPECCDVFPASCD
jgi:hypothetical protein